MYWPSDFEAGHYLKQQNALALSRSRSSPRKIAPQLLQSRALQDGLGLLRTETTGHSSLFGWSLPHPDSSASALPLLPVGSNIVPHLGGLPSSTSRTDGVRSAKSKAVLKLQDLASDKALYEKEKKRFSKDRRAPRTSKEAANLTTEKLASTSSRSRSRGPLLDVLGPRSTVPLKRPLTARGARDIVNDSEEGSEDDSADLNEASQGHESPPMVRDPQPIENAPSGRSYRMCSDSGHLKPTYGALLPDGYQKWSNEQDSWICPVRSCRAIFPALSGLGSHFSVTHRAHCLNDNLDGTLTEISKYGDKRRDGTRQSLMGFTKPAIVVSTGRLSVEEFPLATPKLSSRHQEIAHKKRLRSDANSPVSEQDCTPFDDGKRPAPRPRLSERQHDFAPPSSPNGTSSLATSNFRSYSTWRTDSGDLVPTYGALIPVEYTLDDSLPGRPWICPGRSCRRLFGSVQMLGQHFKRTHRGCQFNDNGDGTLSLISAPDRSSGQGHLRTSSFMDDAPRVISANALNPHEPLMLPPQKPYLGPRRNPQNGNPEWINVFDKMPTTDAPPQQHANSVPESPSHMTRSKSKSKSASKRAATPPLTPCRKPNPGKTEQRGKSTSKRVAASSATRTRSVTTSHSGASVPQEFAISGTRPQRGGPRRSGNRRAERTSDGNVFMDDVAESSEVRTAALPRAAHQNRIFTGQIAPSAILPMQDWEFAPGQMYSTTEGERHTIAYSEAALRTEVTLAPGLTFRIIRLEAGAVMRLQPDADNALQCVLSTGVIQVQVGDEPEFTLGGHGLFLVRPGGTARVQNRVFTPAGAVLHVTKIAHLNH